MACSSPLGTLRFHCDAQGLQQRMRNRLELISTTPGIFQQVTEVQRPALRLGAANLSIFLNFRQAVTQKPHVRNIIYIPSIVV